jgi:hypothetical protein
VKGLVDLIDPAPHVHPERNLGVIVPAPHVVQKVKGLVDLIDPAPHAHPEPNLGVIVPARLPPVGLDRQPVIAHRVLAVRANLSAIKQN